MYTDVAKGVDFLWNNQIKEAEEFFQKAKDSHPRYALHYAEVSDYYAVCISIPVCTAVRVCVCEESC